MELNSANLLGPGLRKLGLHLVKEYSNVSGFGFPLQILTDKSQVYQSKLSEHLLFSSNTPLSFQIPSPAPQILHGGRGISSKEREAKEIWREDPHPWWRNSVPMCRPEYHILTT